MNWILATPSAVTQEFDDFLSSIYIYIYINIATSLTQAFEYHAYFDACP